MHTCNVHIFAAPEVCLKQRMPVEEYSFDSRIVFSRACGPRSGENAFPDAPADEFPLRRKGGEGFGFAKVHQRVCEPAEFGR